MHSCVHLRLLHLQPLSQCKRCSSSAWHKCRSGTALDPTCDQESVTLSSEAKHYLVVDTNVVLHQTDFLEHPAIKDVIILSTVLQEVRNQNRSVYTRLKELIRNADKRFFYFSNEHHKVRAWRLQLAYVYAGHSPSIAMCMAL